MTPPNYTLTFACYNQLDYTQQFIASLDRDEVDFSRIVAVDNGSTDGTREWLGQQGFGGVILNNRNLGCGAAWNQGALAIQSKWTVVMNNDVICAKGWLRNLLASAETNNLHIASPAMVEGELNYDFAAWAQQSEDAMRGYLRKGAPHAVCMAIREDVWNEIGYFMPVPKLLGYEDAIFFQRTLEAGLSTGTTADAWLHHYGMTTQKALKLEMKLDQNDSLGNRNLMRLYMAQSWVARKLARHQRRSLLKAARTYEVSTFGRSVHGIRDADAYEWR
ncbi:glycosyltransferase [Limnohabitans sp.]|uniref:glycosyltransferase family 2 protein n=1 Tax=Limnohabitans sp. TaxID=1907725 RepID=UPI00286ED80E|nr:glycosyltransferase [Limnohabitans sp.]